MRLSIIIVNWNAGPLLRKCLDALPAARAAMDSEVFVVDNASTDDSLARARESRQPFRLISLPVNSGFARANNVALRQARGEILLLLNPDTEPRPGSLDALVEFFVAHPQAGIVGGKLLNPDGSLQRSVRSFPTVGVLALLLTRLARLIPSFPVLRQYEMRGFSYSQSARVDQTMGACFAIRRGVVDAIGLLDEGYWIWFEEVDYCRRAKLAGWETWFTPSAEIVHDRATSFAQVSPLWRAWQFSRSALRYAWKHYGWWAAGGLSLLVPVSLGTALVASLPRTPPGVRRSSSALWAVLRRPLGGTGLLMMLGVGATALFLGLFFSAQAGLLLLAAAWVAVGTWRYPWPTFLLLMATAPFLLILKATVVLGPLTLLKDIVILALFLKSLRGGGSLLASALRVPVLALVLWDMVAFLRADAFALGLLRLRDFLLYVLLLVVAGRQVTTAERRRTFFSVFLGAAALILVLAAIQWVQFPDSMVLRFDAARRVWIPRVSSVLAHPNHLGGYVVFALSLAAAVASAQGLPGRLRLGAGLLTAAGLVATILTYSRSAWIAVPVALVSSAILGGVARAPRILRAALFLVLLAGGAALAVPQARQFVRAVADPAYQSNKTRLEIVAGSLVGVSNLGAVIGEGLGDTATLLQRTADITVYDIVSAGVQEVQVAKARTFVDNGVVKTWIEQGAVGLVIMGWIAVHLLWLGLRAFRHGATPETRTLGTAATAVVCGLAVLWLFLDVSDMFPANLYFWTFAGLVAGEQNRS